MLMLSMRTRVFSYLFCMAVMMMSPMGVFAQDNGSAVDADAFLREAGRESAAPVSASASQEGGAVERSVAAAKAELDDKDALAKKLELARKMHQIRPTRTQVDAAVERAALSVPASQRQAFIGAMRSMLNYNAIERISIDAMVEIYTLKELDAMVAYFSLPEAKSASEKMPIWAQQVQPELARMIDKAIMRVKLGQ